MAETALKFGPEWLRNLSNSSSTSNQPPFPTPLTAVGTGGGTGTKYKLADYRYGREEMLALFDKNISMPDSVKDLTQILAEKCQVPLALTPMSEDEQRMWARSVNSDALQRVTGKGPGPVIAVPRIRGGSVDRGRGRSRGGSFYPRGSSFDDLDGPPGVPISGSRPRGFERSQSIIDRDDRFDRNFSSRLEENGLGRKEIRTDGWRSTSREASDKQDDGGWRSVGPRDKWGGGIGKGSWRSSDRDENDRDPLRDVPIRNGPNKVYSNRRSSQMWDDDSGGDQLPEWSTENDCDTEQLGTFDSAGAFLETKENSRNSSSPEKRRPDAVEERSKENIVPNDVNHDERLSPSLKESSLSPPVSKPSVNNNNMNKTSKNTNFNAGDSEKVDKGAFEGLQTAQKPQGIVPPRTKSPKEDSNKTSELSNVTVVRQSSVNDIEVARAMMEASKRHSELQHKNNPPVPKMELQRPSESLRPPPPSVPMEEVHVVSGGGGGARRDNWQKEKFPPEEENFDLLEMATENMIAQWTAEDEQRVNVRPAALAPTDKVPALKVQHEDAYKWFYKDPQGEVQGPFTSTEMLEWFSAGYFTLDLLVRRGCDEKFTKLGELRETWGRVPFGPGPHPAPIRVLTPVAAPPVVPLPHQMTPNTSSARDTEQELRNMFLQQQLIQQQLLYKQQLHMQHVLNVLKQQESFSSLSQQQQHQVLLQHLIAEQQLQRSAPAGLGEIPGLPDPLSQLHLPLLGLTLPSLMKTDGAPIPPLWGLNPSPNTASINNPPSANNWAMGGQHHPPPNQQSNIEPAAVPGSIWDLDEPNQANAHKSQRRNKEEMDGHVVNKMLDDERQRRMEEDKRRRMEEERRKMEEQRRMAEEVTRKQREEEDEMRRREDMRRQEIEEELRKKEREEDLRRKKELEELQRKKQQEEEEELRKKREEEQLIRIEQQRKAAQEKLKREEDARQKALEQQQRLERERMMQLEHHMVQQAELERKLKQQAELERQHKQQEALLRLQQQQEAQQRAAIPPWAMNQEDNDMPTLALIQIQQREMERAAVEAEQRARLLKIEKENQVAQMQRAQQAKTNNLTWANKSSEPTHVKSLMEIQLEEAEIAAKEEKQKPVSVLSVASGPTVWNNAASSLTWASSSNGSGWSSGLINQDVKPRGFWDDLINTSQQQITTKNAKSGGESAFPALLAKPMTEPGLRSGVANRAKNVRAKKEEETVIKLFETHTLKNADEFTRWCTKAMSNMATSVDVPTFIAFLKDVECPYELNDYVRSYLGESKESREFAKQFLERRSKYRNQSKQPSSEENMWGPAPAITPSLNKGHNDFEGGTGGMTGGGQAPGGGPNPNKSKKKKTKRMHRLDVSMLGFTVQSDPDRINIGEIDHTDGV